MPETSLPPIPVADAVGAKATMRFPSIVGPSTVPDAVEAELIMMNGSTCVPVEVLFVITERVAEPVMSIVDRKSTRLNSSHLVISYAVFCLKKTTSYVAFGFYAAIYVNERSDTDLAAESLGTTDSDNSLYTHMSLLHM